MARLPPYARAASERLKPGRLIWLVIGADAWRYAKQWPAEHRIRLVLPPDEPPASFDWSVTRDHYVMLLRAGDMDRRRQYELVRALLTAGAALVVDPANRTRYVPRNLLDAS